ncbi:MAG: carboxypeptidase regulatory-like domain-containing protein [Planctomycetaceae bacterium]|nr:carboxypeptidase regulatory-like domain-containing protein [Planctomycetaceae bacterium]
MSICLLMLIVSLDDSPVSASEWGSVTGQFVLEGTVPPRQLLHRRGADVKDAECCSKESLYHEDLVVDAKTRGIANVFVYLYRAPRRVHPDQIDTEAVARLKIKGCRYEPHAMVVQAGQSLEFSSQDSALHNPHPFPLRNQASGILLGTQPAVRQPGIGTMWPTSVREPLPIPIKCDIHPWMMSYVLITDHPYAVVTDAQGRFTIENLPVGEHEFRVWHERTGYLDRKWNVTVKPGDNRLPARGFPRAVFAPSTSEEKDKKAAP